MLISPASETSRTRPLFLGILLLFFLSGASGLVYQVIWIRLLSRIFGTTTFAVSALLASFMAGLGLGSFLASRFLHRTGRPLAWFGILEIGIGAYAVALHRIAPAAERLFLGALASFDLGPSGESFAKVLLSFALLLAPTTFMGASLPLLTKQSVRRLSSLGLRTGSLYAVNTLGAATGCFTAGFFLIPLWGMEKTVLAAASINGLVGLSALLAGVFGAAHREDRFVEPVPSRPAPGLRWAVAAFSLSGFAAIGLEVVWTRLFTLVFKAYTYSFTAMLSVVLLGIALGSLAFSAPADRSRSLEALLGRVQMGIAISVVWLTPLLLHYDALMTQLRYQLGYDFLGETLSKFAVSLLVLGVPTFLFGAQFPVVARLATEHERSAGSRVGLLYGMNVLGSILGALATGYLLIPWLGSHVTLFLLSGALSAMALALLAHGARRRGDRFSWTRSIACVAAIGVAALAAPRDLSRAIHEKWLLPREVLHHYEEGATATVMVAGPARGGGWDKRILVNGSSASNSTEYGLSVNRIQGAIPFLFSRAPSRVLATCFGTGITFGTLSQFETERIDGVDISPEVIRAAPQFGGENYDVAVNGRVRIHIDDGRNFLLKSRETYDVITMEPMPPSLAGVTDLYTVEFYDLCRRRLEPGGLVSQWVPLYYLTLQDVRMLFRTFAVSFPHVMVFSHGFDTFLVGSEGPLELAPESFRGRLVSQALARDLERLGLSTPEGMYATFLMDREAALAFSEGASLVTDDLPRVEFSGPRAVDMLTTSGNYLEIMRFARPVTAHLPEDLSPELRSALDAEFERRRVLSESARTLDRKRREARPGSPGR